MHVFPNLVTYVQIFVQITVHNATMQQYNIKINHLRLNYVHIKFDHIFGFQT